MMRKLAGLMGLLALVSGAWAGETRTRGTMMAAIRMDIFSDFQCPACKVLYERTLVPLMASYVDTGKVYLVHHEFPLPAHPHAMEAAEYACAAQRVGKYDQACDVLFRKQQDWANSGKVFETVSSVLTPSEAQKVRTLVKDPAIRAEIQEDVKAGQQARVEGTPTVIVTYKNKQYRVPGNASYEMLSRFLDQLMGR